MNWYSKLTVTYMVHLFMGTETSGDNIPKDRENEDHHEEIRQPGEGSRNPLNTIRNTHDRLLLRTLEESYSKLFLYTSLTKLLSLMENVSRIQKNHHTRCESRQCNNTPWWPTLHWPIKMFLHHWSYYKHIPYCVYEVEQWTVYECCVARIYSYKHLFK